MLKILFVLLLISHTPPALVDVACGTYGFISRIAITAKEKLFITLQGSFNNIEIWINKEKKTWSAFSTDKKRTMACFKASGKGYKIDG